MGRQRDHIKLSCDEIKMFLGTKFITESCVLLRLSYQVRYKSLLLFYNFCEKIDFMSLCTASILLASKLEEEVCTLKRIIYVFNYLYTEYESKPKLLTSRLSTRLKEGCIMAETEILRSLGFNVIFEDVYGVLVDFLESQELSPSCMKDIFSFFNSLMIWPEVRSLDSKSLILMAIEAAFDEGGRFKEVLEKYRAFEERKFNLETYEEISAVKKINSALLQSFAKRQKYN